MSLPSMQYRMLKVVVKDTVVGVVRQISPPQRKTYRAQVEILGAALLRVTGEEIAHVPFRFTLVNDLYEGGTLIESSSTNFVSYDITYDASGKVDVMIAYDMFLSPEEGEKPLPLPFSFEVHPAHWPPSASSDQESHEAFKEGDTVYLPMQVQAVVGGELELTCYIGGDDILLVVPAEEVVKKV